MTKTRKSLEARIHEALNTLFEGVKEHQDEVIDMSLEALSELMLESVQVKDFAALEHINTGLKSLFSEHRVLRYAIEGKLSLDSLEQILQHTTPGATHLIWNAQIPHMTPRMGTMLALNHARFKPTETTDAHQLLIQFLSKKHQEAFSIIFAHLATATLSLDAKAYSAYKTKDEFILNSMVRYIRSDEQLRVMIKTMNQHQDLVLAHLKRANRSGTDNALPIKFEHVQMLHKLGFDRLPQACMPGLLYSPEHDRQFIMAEKMGVTITKDMITRVMTADQKPFVDHYALAYALESPNYTLEDLRALRLAMEQADADENAYVQVCPFLPQIASLAFDAVMKGQRETKNKQLLEKAEFLIDWVLKQQPGEEMETFKKTVVSLRSLPRSISESRKPLRDSMFSADLGL